MLRPFVRGFIPTAKLKNGRDSPRKAREANLRILELLTINNRDDWSIFRNYHNEPHRLSNQKNFVYQAEIGD